MTPSCATMPRYGATSRRQEVRGRLRSDRAEQRRPEQDAGDHLADHRRLADGAEQTAEEPPEQ